MPFMIRNLKGHVLVMVCLAMVVTLMCGCKKENKPFKMKVELQGLGSQQVKVVYSDADGSIIDYWTKCENHTFEIAGTCSDPSLLMVYNKMDVPILKLVVAGGDELEIKGKVIEPYNLKVKGSEAAERYNDFVVKHKMEYKSAISQELNTAIENYVKDNPKSIVSTSLVMLDYNPDDNTKIDKLLNTIDDSAKPESLINSYNQLKARTKKPAA